MEFLEELMEKRPVLRGKIDETQTKMFIWDNFRSENIHVGPVLDIHKSYRYEKIKQKRRFNNLLTRIKDCIIKRVIRNRELAESPLPSPPDMVIRIDAMLKI